MACKCSQTTPEGAVASAKPVIQAPLSMARGPRGPQASAFDPGLEVRPATNRGVRVDDQKGVT